MTNRSFQDQIQDLWRTRPARLPSRGHVAGVCSGIGYRYGVDPVLVRVAFVVSTIFGGAGILLYLAGWLVLPKEGETASPAEALVGRGHSSDSGTKTVVLLVALAIAASTVGPAGVGLGGSGVIGLALMLGGLWLLYQRQPIPPAQPATLAPSAAGYPGGAYPTGQFPTTGFPTYGPYTRLPDHYVPERPPAPEPPKSPNVPPADPTGRPAGGKGETSASPEQQEPTSTSGPREPVPGARSTAGPATTPPAATGPQPPSWDPLGVAPFAWDLPEPKAEPLLPVAPKGPRSRLTPVTIGLAIIAAAVAGGIAAGTDADWLTPGRIGAIALAVIGIGLILGGFLRRGYGLLIVTAPLAGFVVLASLVGPIDFDQRTMGEQVWTPASAAALDPEYSIRFGSGTLDLRNTTLDEDTTVDVSSRFGEMIVVVPPTMNIVDHCETRFGNAECLTDGTVDGGTDGTDGPVLTINAESRFGSVEVRRG
ncbi:PspC domain-containing protein [Rhodococcus triatomae]|nr:PspC domain-containing protein [Rhodococcus triatomae]QNG19558.1 PspC domain-containing protein [Rhodococcus triatomae]QNG24527.1 PspC domain-containing protein [Rhodococcus triatomae]